MYFYYKMNSAMYRVLDVKNYIFSDMSHEKCMKLEYAYQLFKGYEASDEGIKQYGKDFRAWCREMRFTKNLSIDYKKFHSHLGAVKCVFMQYCRGKYEHHEKIKKVENGYFQDCYNAGLQFCEPGVFNSYGYDFSGFYPSLLIDDNFLIPAKKGKEKYLKKLKKRFKLKYGIYRVKITSDNKNFKKIFSFSPKHTYTHISLKHAMKYKKKFDVNIELIVDDKPNAYIYRTKDLVKASEIFGEWYNRLIQLKKLYPKNKLVKHLMSSLWGTLTQYNMIYKSYDELEKEGYDWGYTKECDYIVQDKYMSAHSNDEENYKLLDSNNPFKYNIRLLPFLLSYARNKIAEVALKDIDNVIRIHTDNVTFKKDPKLDIPNLLREDKTSGMIEWRHVNGYNHICPKCDERLKYKDIKTHIEECC